MSDSKKDIDYEVDIKFTVDKQIRDLYKKQGIIEDDGETEGDKTSTIDLGAQASEESVSLEINEEENSLEINEDDDDNSDLDLDEPTEATRVPLMPKEATTPQPRLIFFDYRSEFFAYLIKELDDNLNYTIVEEFEELPRELQSGENIILFLNYSAYPKLCAQLIPKVKTKFQSVKIVIVAKNLTPDKVQAHKNSPEGVHEYLSFPFSRDDFFRVVSGEG